MPLQWSSPTAPEFPVVPTGVQVSATKDLGDGARVSMTGQLTLGVEGPEPSEEDAVGWLGVVYDALKADGWTVGLRFEETAVSRRHIEEV
jgi:hypothetical protein